MISTEVGDSIPPNTRHAVSVCLPTWEATIGYEEGEKWVVDKMTTGYPRFFIHDSVRKLCDVLKDKFAKEDETCLVFPSYEVAKRCREYCKIKSPSSLKRRIRILQLATTKPMNRDEETWKRECKIAVVFAEKEVYPLMRQYWQHSGEIISSRLAEYVLDELFAVEKKSGEIIERDGEEFVEKRFGRNLDFSFADRAKLLIKRRIARKVADVEEEDEQRRVNDNHAVLNMRTNGDSVSSTTGSITELNPAATIPSLEQDSLGENDDYYESQVTVDSEVVNRISTIPAEPIDEVEFEQLNISVAYSEISNEDLIELNDKDIYVDPEKDVFLFPSGMASIFTAHRLLLELDSKRVRRTSINTNEPIGYGGSYKKTAMFGFPYTDTLSILRKFNHTHFLGYGDSRSMDELKEILHSGEQILAVFVETPSNPLLKMADLIELKRLSELYGFYIVIDETVGGFVNIDVLPYADILCSSLTKVFSGDSNVMAGSIVLNPRSKLYEFACSMFHLDGKWHEDLLWCEDAIFLERNSRDFISRSILINQNAEFLLKEVLLPNEGQGKLFKKIYYPSCTSPETKSNYDAVKSTSQGSGYGGLLSLTFHHEEEAKLFFNSLKLCKGPSLGTNFTLACPYTILAHYQELDQVAKYGLERSLVRISIGLEDKSHLQSVFKHSIQVASSLRQ